MHLDTAEHSLIGQRADNQDRLSILWRDGAVLGVAVDGMGGHEEGARAADSVLAAARERFEAAACPFDDPPRFLHELLMSAHAAAVSLGAGMPLQSRPRATCALVLLQDDTAWWAHVGDSRVYLLRAGETLQRTRDHTHVERLFQRGYISEREMLEHPSRHIVESCLGGDEEPPLIDISQGHRLLPGDVLLACTDGFWSGIDPDGLRALCTVSSQQFNDLIGQLAEDAVLRGTPNADNASVVALRWWRE